MYAEYEMKIEKKKISTQKNKQFKTMKFHLAELRACASDKPSLEAEVAKDERELAGYKWVSLKEAKDLWKSNEFGEMMGWAEGKIPTLKIPPLNSLGLF